MKTIRSMLKHLFLAVPLMLIVSCNSQPPSTLIPHRCENGKFGYVDEKGNVINNSQTVLGRLIQENMIPITPKGEVLGKVNKKSVNNLLSIHKNTILG